jgi:hypothetical protein
MKCRLWRRDPRRHTDDTGRELVLSRDQAKRRLVKECLDEMSIVET